MRPSLGLLFGGWTIDILGSRKNSGGGVFRQDMLVSEPNDAVEVERGGLVSRVILEVELPGVPSCLAVEGEGKRDIMADAWIFILSH